MGIKTPYLPISLSPHLLIPSSPYPLVSLTPSAFPVKDFGITESVSFKWVIKMTNIFKYSVSALLILFSGLLATLVPGGPIETRNFSHINPLILGTFNTFLTSLVIISLLIVYFIFKNMNWAFIASVILGVYYLLVYALDLGTIFPVSPDSMPQTLFAIEILGTIVSLPLIFLSIQGAMTINSHDSEQVIGTKGYGTMFVYLTFLMIFIGAGIITFATKSAMGI